MLEQVLAARRLLVVEDEYLIATELIKELEEAGAVIFGPVSDVERAMEIVDSDFPLDGAILDINLRGELVYPVAARLVERDVPMVFVTGYECKTLPEPFANAPCLTKPFDERELIKVVAQFR